MPTRPRGPSLDARLSVATGAMLAALQAAGLPNPAAEPLVEGMVPLWTKTMNGRSILDGMALVFAGLVAIRGELEEAQRDLQARELARLWGDLDREGMLDT